MTTQGENMRRIQIAKQLALGVALAGIWSPQVWAQAEQPAADEVVDSNEIIVSARRKDESVQDVPMTVNVITDQKLKDLNLFNGSDLVNVAPGLTFAPNIPGSTPTLALRGAAKGDAGGRLDPTVQTYMNEAPVTEVLIAEALYDIGQVEVLRGPQGTLRGRPSATGAITVTTKRPNLTKIEGTVSASVSTLNQFRGEAGLNVPLVQDVLAVRVAGVVDHNENDGVRSLFYSGKPYQRMHSWRVSARFKPVDNLDINVMYQDFQSKRATLNQVAGNGYPGSVSIKSYAAGFNGPVISSFDRLSVSDNPAIRQLSHQNLIGTIVLDLGSHKISYVGQYNKTNNINYGGGNLAHILPIPMKEPNPRNLDGRTKLITQELRLESVGNSFFDYGIGGYYEKNTSNNLVDNLFPELGTYGPVGAGAGLAALAPMTLAQYNFEYQSTIRGTYPVNWKNQAVFANATLHITPKTDLFAGVRYVDYQQDSDGFLNVLPGKQNVGPLGCFAPGAIPSTRFPGTCDLAKPQSVLIAPDPIKSKETAWVYNASLTHRFTDDLTAYMSYGHSWRPRTNNLSLYGTDPAITKFRLTDSETSNNYEIGIKTSLLDRRLTFNAAVFHQKFKNFMYLASNVYYLDVVSPTRQVRLASLSTNAANAKTTGFDLEIAYRPSRQFSISANVNYARGRLSDALVPCNDANNDGNPDVNVIPTVADFGTSLVKYCRSSKATSFQSDWKANMQAEYNMPIGGDTDAYIRTLVNYSPSNPNAPDDFTADAYALVNLFLGVRGHDGNWDVGAYARNLFNANKIVYQGPSLGTPADAQGYVFIGRTSGYRLLGLTPRREFGITARYSF